MDSPAEQLARQHHDAALAAHYGILPAVDRLQGFITEVLDIGPHTIAYDPETAQVVISDGPGGVIQIAADDLQAVAGRLGGLAAALGVLTGD